MPIDRKALGETIRRAVESETSAGGSQLAMTATAIAAGLRFLGDYIDKIESRRSMVFEGAFDPGRTYEPGACVQRSGALHVCLTTTNETPGSSAHWRRIAGP